MTHSKEILRPARYELISTEGISFGSFSDLQRATEYRDALLRLRGLTCDIKDNEVTSLDADGGK